MRSILKGFYSLCAFAGLALTLAGCGGAEHAPVTTDAGSSNATTVVTHPPVQVMGFGATTWKAGQGYQPSQIRHAYGFDTITNDGRGQTIAIVDAYDAPNIAADVATFSTQFKLPQFNVTGGPTFKKVNQTGGTALPARDGGWAQETSLDVEWAHAIAPRANILLVEAKSSYLSDLLAAVDYAARNAHQVSMSWGGSEFSSETSYDFHFNIPGVSFFASSGDSGGAREYPAMSPFVVSVGGTSLPLDASGNLKSAETAWSSGGGGVSAYEVEPGYQINYGITGTKSKRGDPDVSYVGNPSTGVAVYDSYAFNSQSGWLIFGGTSVGAPQWAALNALANQSRVAAGRAYLTSASFNSSSLYNAGLPVVYATNYRDIKSGTNGNTATTGYDLATGMGSPLAGKLVPYLATH